MERRGTQHTVDHRLAFCHCFLFHQRGMAHQPRREEGSQTSFPNDEDCLRDPPILNQDRDVDFLITPL